MNPAKTPFVYIAMIVLIGAGIALYKYREKQKANATASEHELERVIGKRPLIFDPFNDAILGEAEFPRFVPITRDGVNGDFAMDTQTGRLCKSWAWELKESNLAIDQVPTCRAMLIEDGKYIEQRIEKSNAP